jgi:DNA-binding LacI/PurR family transcriptional regulator
MQSFNSFHVEPAHGTTLAHQIKQHITWLIASGKLKPGDLLPPIRTLAAQLGVNLHTVRSAYHKLEADGLAETRRGKGTHVLGFHPACFTQAETPMRSHTIGVILPSWTNPFYHALLEGIESVMDEDQTLILLSNAHDDPHLAFRAFNMLSAKGVDGILSISHNLCEFLNLTPQTFDAYSGVPFVCMDTPESCGYAVNIDLASIGRLAAEHLLSHGHKRIGCITFYPYSENIAPVYGNFMQALRAAGLQTSPDLTAIVPDFSQASGAEGMRALLGLAEPPTAIFALADMLALGALQTAKQAGIHIPDQLALISFNDIPAAALSDPPLTSIATPAAQLGLTSAQMLKALIEGRKPVNRRVTLPVNLVIRQSCGCRP